MAGVWGSAAAESGVLAATVVWVMDHARYGPRFVSCTKQLVVVVCCMGGRGSGCHLLMACMINRGKRLSGVGHE